MYSRIFLLIALLLIPAGHSLRAQSDAPLWLQHADTLQLRRGDTLRLPHRFVQREGLRVVLLTPAERDVTAEAALDGPAGHLLLPPALLSDSVTAVAVRYASLPLQLPLEYRLRRLLRSQDSAAGGDLRVAAPSQPLNMESIFGSELQKSGYIGRGFTVGSNRDLSINSGFRLQLAGKLSDDITVTGALTDENTPIQPEGNTRTIQELDRVYINIAGNGMSATLGDFPLSYGDTEFGRYNRKLSGVLGEAESGATRAAVSYATLNGTYHSVQFNGIDGVQGPYRLTGRNGEQPILVLAGTENVYVDGVKMTRGERNDYVIEYANGEITFTPNRLVTAYSRITVDYEYAEREYTRSMITADLETALFDDVLTVGARYIREADDEGSPIDLDFSDEDRDILSAAGDDPQSAARSGVTYVGYDTARGAGAGQYLRVDSTVAGAPYTLYRYAPGSDSATYVISFSFVGQGRGDYRRQTVGTFVFAGVGGGDYAPLRLLPLPRLHQLLDLRLRANPRDDLQLQGELGVSDLDRNRFSDADDGDNTGAAYNLGINWKPQTRRLGDFDLSLRYRDVDARFQPVDRINDIEFNRKWDIGTPAVARERMTEGRAAWSPWQQTRIAAGAGSIARGAFSSLRLDGGLTITPAAADSGLPALDYGIEYIDSDDGAAGIRGSWLRQRGTAEYRGGLFIPRLRVEQEHRESRSTGSDTLRPESLAFVDVRPGVLFPSFWNMTFSADVGVRVEDVADRGALARQSTDILQVYGWQLRPWNDLSSEISVTVRDRRYSEQFRARGFKDIQTVLTRAQTRYAPLNGGVQTDLLYEVSTERTSRLQRVFLNVPFGQGNYEYLGDLNGNGVQDEEEFERTRYEGDYVLLTLPTDELFPVIDLRSSLRLRLRPERFLPRTSTSFGTDVLRALSAESFIRIEEKSEESRTSDIYLLRLSRFLDDSTTIRGYQNFRQDLFLFERAQDFSLRLRFDERRGFSQYALASERSYRRERSLRIKTQLVREIGLQVDAIFLDDEVRATAFSSRARDIVSSNIVTDLSYRPWRNLEIGFVIDSKSATDSYPETPVQADITALTLRSVTSFSGPGRLRAEIERSTVTFDTEIERAPFELTDGRVEGQSWIWRINFDYRLTDFMQATLSYLGRAEGERDTIHIARAEVKAFF